MRREATPTSRAVVVFARSPLFRFAPTTRAAEICTFDPHLALCLVPETIGSIAALLEGGSDAARKEAERAALIRDAYHDLAAVFHPDANASSTHAFSAARRGRYGFAAWMSNDAIFSVVTTAYQVLSDPRTTVEYLIATGAAGGGVLAQQLRRRVAEDEARSMAHAIDAAIAVQLERQRHHGDGLFVQLALYGDQRAMLGIIKAATASANTTVGCNVSSGNSRVIDVTRVISGHTELVASPNRGTGSSGGISSTVQLVLPPGSKKTLEGFWDPCDGFPSHLFVRYHFLGRVHEVCVTDEAPLRCPLKKHQVLSAPPVTHAAPPVQYAQHAVTAHGPGSSLGVAVSKTAVPGQAASVRHSSRPSSSASSSVSSPPPTRVDAAHGAAAPPADTSGGWSSPPSPNVTTRASRKQRQQQQHARRSLVASSSDSTAAPAPAAVGTRAQQCSAGVGETAPTVSDENHPSGLRSIGGSSSSNVAPARNVLPTSAAGSSSSSMRGREVGAPLNDAGNSALSAETVAAAVQQQLLKKQSAAAPPEQLQPPQKPAELPTRAQLRRRRQTMLPSGLGDSSSLPPHADDTADASPSAHLSTAPAGIIPIIELDGRYVESEGDRHRLRSGGHTAAAGSQQKRHQQQNHTGGRSGTGTGTAAGSGVAAPSPFSGRRGDGVTGEYGAQQEGHLVTYTRGVDASGRVAVLRVTGALPSSASASASHNSGHSSRVHMHRRGGGGHGPQQHRAHAASGLAWGAAAAASSAAPGVDSDSCAHSHTSSRVRGTATAAATRRTAAAATTTASDGSGTDVSVRRRLGQARQTAAAAAASAAGAGDNGPYSAVDDDSAATSTSSSPSNGCSPSPLSSPSSPSSSPSPSSSSWDIVGSEQDATALAAARRLEAELGAALTAVRLQRKQQQGGASSSSGGTLSSVSVVGGVGATTVSPFRRAVFGSVLVAAGGGLVTLLILMKAYPGLTAGGYYYPSSSALRRYAPHSASSSSVSA